MLLRADSAVAVNDKSGGSHKVLTFHGYRSLAKRSVLDRDTIAKVCASHNLKGRVHLVRVVTVRLVVKAL